MSTLVRAASLTHYVEVARQCGLDPWRLLREAGVSVLDAAAFGEPAQGFVRLSFTLGEERLSEACRRSRDFVRVLHGEAPRPALASVTCNAKAAEPVVAKTMIDTVYGIAMKPVQNALGGAIASGLQGLLGGMIDVGRPVEAKVPLVVVGDGAGMGGVPVVQGGLEAIESQVDAAAAEGLDQVGEIVELSAHG